MLFEKAIILTHDPGQLKKKLDVELTVAKLNVNLNARLDVELTLSFRIRIRIFNGLEKGACAPSNHEHAFLQREEPKDKKQICWMPEEG